jgi:hypothetical protein
MFAQVCRQNGLIGQAMARFIGLYDFSTCYFVWLCYALRPFCSPTTHRSDDRPP